MRASSFLCGVTVLSVARCLSYAAMLTSHIRDMGTRSTALYLRVLMLDTKLPNRFSVMRRKLELRFRFIEDYEITG
jgi:hypothetical protein